MEYPLWKMILFVYVGHWDDKIFNRLIFLIWWGFTICWSTMCYKTVCLICDMLFCNLLMC